MATHRTTIVLPVALKRTVTELARSQGLSFGEFVRRAVARAAAGSPVSRDTLLDDPAVFEGEVPCDLSEKHDSYLYGQ